ncbi:hypothetical protein CEXT_619031 [Caerostris extrusa]|uniref:Uncharacterized protein n=1 Tax=Caerostris extrusa TaxID=172846 RepID=A0AAV4T3X9_CAEEX|nr:hypothetical protein CEXT_619031 [Caerostris extrusa]
MGRVEASAPINVRVQEVGSLVGTFLTNHWHRQDETKLNSLNYNSRERHLASFVVSWVERTTDKLPPPPSFRVLCDILCDTLSRTVSNKESLWSEIIQGVHNETMNRSPLKALVGRNEHFWVLCDILCDTLSHTVSNKDSLWSEIIQGGHNETMNQSPLKALVGRNETPGFIVSGEWHQCVKTMRWGVLEARGTFDEKMRWGFGSSRRHLRRDIFVINICRTLISFRHGTLRTFEMMLD